MLPGRQPCRRLDSPSVRHRRAFHFSGLAYRGRARALPLHQGNQADPRPLILAGFDHQNSTVGSSAGPDAFQRAIAKIDPGYADVVLSTDLDFQNTIYDSANWQAGEQNPLFTMDLSQWLTSTWEGTSTALRACPRLPLVLRQAAWSQAREIETKHGLRCAGRVQHSLLGNDNIDALLEQLYPGQEYYARATTGRGPRSTERGRNIELGNAQHGLLAGTASPRDPLIRIFHVPGRGGRA